MSMFLGRVMKCKANNTVKVSVTRSYLHPLVLKYTAKRRKFEVHDEKSCNVGDLVLIKEMQQKIQDKAFRVSEIIERAETYTDPETGEIHYQPFM
uniref:30S ribosomal protein S17 n=1 Tax=Amphimedon queenslandica TaxID=400682 RepID=I1EGK9_AMPQE